MNIPFDILGHIFSHYAETETITYPLETLLLVSRSWSDAALGHRALWSHLKVHIASWRGVSSVKIWKTRLPLRLKRCGDTLPLHIELRHLPSVRSNINWELHHKENRPNDCPQRGNIDPRAPCTCVRETRLCIDGFLILLAGQGGELCKRWSTLYLNLHDPSGCGVVYKQLGHVVRHPMPILTSLTIQGIYRGIGPGSFPHTPLLQRLVMICSDVLLPSLQSVRSLSIVRASWSIYEIPDEASNIEELALEGSFRLPKSLPNLWRLRVAGIVYRPSSEVLQLPKLTHLEVENHGPQRFDAWGTAKGIDLLQLVALTVHLDLESSYSDFKANTEEILRRSKNLSIIQGNPKGISMILKLVWETEAEWSETRDYIEREWEEVRLLAGKVISIESEGESARLQGDETCGQLCEVAARLKVDLPNASWGDILDENMYDGYWR